MLQDKQDKANIGVATGIILQILAIVRCGKNDEGEILGLLVLLAGTALFVWGCMNYTVGKGYSKWLGLIDASSLPGLIILVLLPDQHKSSH